MPHGGLQGGAGAYGVHNNMNIDPYKPPRAVVAPVHTPGHVGLLYRGLNWTYGLLSLALLFIVLNGNAFAADFGSLITLLVFAAPSIGFAVVMLGRHGGYAAWRAVHLLILGAILLLVIVDMFSGKTTPTAGWMLAAINGVSLAGNERAYRRRHGAVAAAPGMGKAV